MNLQKPILDNKKIEAFLDAAPATANQASARNQDGKKNRVTKAAKARKVIATSNTTGTKNTNQKPIGKFMVEMPMALRKKIKFKAVANGIAMNELIVALLQQHFK